MVITESSTGTDMESDNTCPKSYRKWAGMKAQLNCTQLSTAMGQGEVTGSDPVAQALGMGKPQQSSPAPNQVLKQRKRPFKVNPHFFPVNDWGFRLQTNSTQIQPELMFVLFFFFFGHESGKNVNLLRSWLVSFCDNCLSSLKPPTRCTSSLTEME